MAEKETVKPTPMAVSSGTSYSPPGSSSEKQAFGHQIDGDDALQLVGAESGPIVIDEATNKRLLRRIDWVMMPMLCLIYGLQFLDKTTLSYASITGIQKDIGLHGDEYQWLGSLFYFGYLGFEYPAALLLQKLPMSKYSGFCIIAWGVVLTAFAGVKNYGGAIAIRLLLGVFEASVSPAWILFTSQWYKVEEQPSRTAWWVSFNGWGQIFGGVVAYGIATGAEKHGFTLAPWKIIYVFTGVLTIAVGIIFLIVVPDNQLNAWWLSKEDRVPAVERVRGNQQGIGNRHFKMYQLREALTDPITWAFFILALVGDIANGGLSNFFNLLIVSFGYTKEESLLYGAIIGACEIVGVLGWAYASQRWGNRILLGTLGALINLIGGIILVALPDSMPKGRLAGFYLSTLYVVALVTLVSLISSNVAGYTKKTTVAALFFIAYCAGNIIGPQTFRPKDAPNYYPAKIVLTICAGLNVIDMIFIYFWYRRQNRLKRERQQAAGYVKLENQEFLDLTDKENPEFMYVM